MVNIYGKEIGFAFTVGAAKELADLCPDKDLSRLGEASGENLSDRLSFTIDLILILNKAWCAIKTLEGETVAPVTREMLETLSPKKLMSIGTEAMQIIHEDSEGEIEVEGKKEQGVD